MAKKKITKTSKRRLLLFGTISIAVIISFFISLSCYVIDIYNLKHEARQLEHKVVELERDEENLKTQIDMLKDEEYLARYARENYLYSKDGEIVFKIESSKKKEDASSNKISFDSKYFIIAGVGMIFLLILYVSLKKGK